MTTFLAYVLGRPKTIILPFLGFGLSRGHGLYNFKAQLIPLIVWFNGHVPADPRGIANRLGKWMDSFEALVSNYNYLLSAGKIKDSDFNLSGGCFPMFLSKIYKKYVNLYDFK